MTSPVLITFPGRAGDLLWALPTVRAISESLGHPVDLQVCGEFEGMVELLRQQSYLGHVSANPHWDMTQGWEAPMPVGTPEGTYERVIQLGYRRWPELPLPDETFAVALQQVSDLPLLDLTRPWITVKPAKMYGAIAVGWSDCYFELKYGLSQLLFTSRNGRPFWDAVLLPPAGSRWTTEGVERPCGWLEAAAQIAGAPCFLGDCSALHVLAVALGIPVVLMEPMEARHNVIFYPLGTEGRVRLVRGNDGLPTFDARHVADALREVLRAGGTESP